MSTTVTLSYIALLQQLVSLSLFHLLVLKMSPLYTFQVKTKKKAEIQALSSFGFQYITETYLPRKLREGDWL